MNAQPSLKRDLGLFAAITIVVGNMIGSGVFGLPSALASVSTPVVTLLAWVFAGLGATIIALSYGRLSQAIPEAGGPVAYTHKALGAFAGYSVCLAWWMASVIGNAAMVDLVYTQVVRFLPGVAAPLSKLGITLLFLWAFTYANIRGVKTAGMISVVTTVLKTGVFLAIILLAIPYLKPDLLTSNSEYARSVAENSSFFGMFAAAMALIFWAFAGLESSTLAGGEIKNPERNIKYSIIFGLIFVSLFYVVINFSLLALIPQDRLAASSSPFADAINLVTGATFGGKIVDAAILISVIGALSGWLLTAGRSIYAAGKDKMFLPHFASVHPRFRTPHVALIVSSVITSLFLLIDYLLTVYDAQSGISTFVSITTVASIISLPTYLTTVISEVVLIKKGEISAGRFTRLRLSLAVVFSLFFIYLGVTGSYVPMVYWYATAAFFGVGIALYPYFKAKSA